MSVQTISASYSSNIDVALPSNSRNIRVTLAGGRGGDGGQDIGNSFEAPGIGGQGRVGSFTLTTNFVARTLQFRVGGAGANGSNGSSSAAGIGGAGGAAGAAAGGRGQNERQSGWSGGGGGGGGATGVFDTSFGWVAVAGGGGGAGGASDFRVGGVGGTGAAFGAGGVNPSNGAGFGTEFTSGDGGGGGGGGGGSPGGARGSQGDDDAFSSTGGAGGGSTYNSSRATLNNQSTNGGSGFASLTYELVTPEINTFTATPNPQTSGIDGIPNFDTFLSWTTTDAQTVTINQGIGSVSVDGGTTVTNLPQSTSGVTSPATRTYTLTACAGTVCVTRNLTVSVTNDNTPDNYTVPSSTNVEPSTATTVQVGPITGIDMVTTVSGGPGVSVSNNNVTFSSSTTIQNNGIFYVRVTSLPFNTNPNGLTNSAQFSVTVGTLQRFFTVTTRAPDVNETFNFSNKDDYVPTPDIDTIPDPDADIRNQANLYIVSDTLLIDDIELGSPTGVEIKTNNPNAQIRVKRSGSSTFENWQDVRSI